MNSELGMLLPFVFGLVVVVAGTRVILARTQIQKGETPGREPLIADLASRVQQLEETLDATTREVQRLAEAEQFLTRLLSEKAEAPITAPDRSGSSRGRT